MRLAFDAKRALNNISGLGNYSRTLLNGLMRYFPENEYLLFTPKVNDALLSLLQGDFSLLLPQRQLHKTIHPLWRSFGLSKQLVKLKTDLYHGLSNELPFNANSFNIPKIVTIHDVLFLHHPEDFPVADRTIYYLKTSFACKHADVITVNSFQTQNDLVEKFGVFEKKIAVVHHAVSENFLRVISEEEIQSVRIKYHLPDKFILQTGSFLGRKNHLLTVRAFKEVALQTDLHLVFAGCGGNQLNALKSEIEKLRLQSRVHIISGISHVDMPGIYKASQMVVYPSLNEGFGLPILESFAVGVPVVTTAGKCFAEVAGDAAVFIDPLSESSLQSAILELADNSNLTNQLIEKGKSRLPFFTEEKLARETMALYEHVA